jgi:hypothetical protein
MRSLVSLPPDRRARRTLALLAAGVFLLQFGAWLGQNLALSVVLQRQGAAGLPLMFVLNAAGMAVTAYPTLRLVRRFALQAVLPAFFALAALAVGVLHWASSQDAPCSPAALYVTAFVVTDLGLALFWSLTHQLYDTRSARRYVPLLGALGTLGAALSGFFAKAAVSVVSGEQLLDVWAASLVLGALWAWRAVKLLPPTPGTARGWRSDALPPLAGPDRALWIAIGTGLAGVMLLALVGRFEYGRMLNELYGSDLGRIAATNGLLIGVGSLVTLAAQLAATPWLMARFGLGGAGTIFPAAMFVALAAAIAAPGLLAAVLLFLATTSLRQGVQALLEPVLYTPFPPERAAQAVVFMTGFALPSGMLLAGLLLGILAGAPPWLVPLLGMLGAAALLGIALWRARAYRGALRARLARGGKELRIRYAALLDGPDATIEGELLRSLAPDDPQLLERLRTLIRVDARRRRSTVTGLAGEAGAIGWDERGPLGAIVDGRARESYRLLAVEERLGGMSTDPGVTVLWAGAIRHRLADNVAVILAALHAGTHHEDYARISLNVFDAPPRVRAAAVEILEGICPAALRPIVVPLVEGMHLEAGRRAAERRYGELPIGDPVAMLLEIPDPWLQACTVYAAAHLDAGEYAPLVRTLQGATDPFLAFSCEFALGRLGAAG